MKLALLLLLACATAALATNNACSKLANYTVGRPSSVSSMTTNCACLDTPPNEPVCACPFETLQNGACVKTEVLISFLDIEYPNGTKGQQLVYVGNTNEDFAPTGSPISGCTGVIDIPDPLAFVTGGPNHTIWCMAVDGSLCNIDPLLYPNQGGFKTVWSYPGFWSPQNTGYGLHVTAVAFSGTSFYVATEDSGSPIIWTFDVTTPDVPPSIFYIPDDGTTSFTYLSVTKNGRTLIASTATSVLAIPIVSDPNGANNIKARIPPHLTSRFSASIRLTTGGTATLTYPSTSSSGATISGAISDTAGNAYYTENDLGGAYSIQKIAAAVISAGTNPAPTIALYPSGSAGSFTAPVLDKYNSLYWAVGGSSSSLNGVFVCKNVPTTNTSPGVCSATTVYKWPVTSQVQNGNVVVTVNNIIYG